MRKAQLRYSSLLAQAKTQAKRTPDGGFDEDELLRALEALIVVDPDLERRRIAKNIIDSETKPGATDPNGQLKLPGFEDYEYEPCRLIRDHEGHIIEQDKASHSYKFAESERAAKHSEEAARWANRKRKEVEILAKWIIEEQKKGRRRNLTFGDCVREAGIWH